MRLPKGYLGIRHNRNIGFALPTALDWTKSVLNSGSTLYNWAYRHSTGCAQAGRSEVYILPVPTSVGNSTHWVVRHYWRGGIFRSQLSDRHLIAWTPRPIAELWVNVEARSRGIPTPRIIAGTAERSGIFYRADLVTEWVPDTTDLTSALFTLSKNLSFQTAALIAAGRLVSLLENKRILHADLNASNILLNKVNGVLAAHVIDLDRCQALSPTARAPVQLMRRRLERSLRKLEERYKDPLDKTLWAALYSSYETKQ